MHYEGNVIRPPSEADSIILQVTVGCSHNRCTFCGAYTGEKFRIKEEETVAADLDFAARYCLRQHKVFLADGDVLILSQKRLVELFGRIRQKLAWVKRISLYGSARSIRAKSVEELLELKDLGLDRIYMGLESGYDPVLARVRKGTDAQGMIEASRKTRAAGLFLSVTVLLGLAGIEESALHAEATGRILTAMAPNQIGVLTMMLIPGTPLAQAALSGEFTMPDQATLLLELRTMVQNIELERVQFQTNHASNYLPINGRFPKDKQHILTLIDQALAGKHQLTPEYMRRL